MENLLANLLLLGNGTGYDEGDSLQIYYDDDTDEIKVYLNFVEITEAPFPELVTANPILQELGGDPWYQIVSGATLSGSQVISNYQFCDETTLVRFIMQESYPLFPYMVRDETPDSYLCALTPVVCDLEIDNLVTVINATNKFTSDGQITVNATSSNGNIEYSLSPFSFGAGQASGVFSGLLGGTYTVYAVDEVGCVDNIKVTVGEDSIAYNDYILYEYMDKDKLKVHEIRIQRLNWNGDVKVVTHGSGMPVNYVKQSIGIHEKLGGVEGSALEVNLWANFNGEFRNLFTQNDRRYRVIWSKDKGSGKAEVWRGWIQPSIYSEPYLTPPYQVNIVCYDGLSTLNQFDFTDDSGNLLRGRIKIIDVISLVLRKLDLDLGIRVNCNLFEISQDESEGFIWDQALLDMSWFRDDKNEPKTCFQVMDDILTSVGGRLLQWGGYWWLTRREDETETYTYREFDKNGQFVEENTYNPIVTEYRQLMQDQVLEVIPSYGLTIFERPLNERLSLIPGEFERFDLVDANNNAGGFRGWSLSLGGSSVSFRRGLVGEDRSVALIDGFTVDGRSAFIQSETRQLQYRAGDFLRISFDFGFNNIDSAIPFVTIRFKFKLGSRWLGLQGAWVNSETVYRHYATPQSGLQKFELIVPLPAVSGVVEEDMDIAIYNYRIDVFNADAIGLTAFRGIATTGLTNGYKADVIVTSGFTYADFYELEFGTDAEDLPAIVEPDDYDGSTNPKVWKLVKRLRINDILDISEVFLVVPEIMVIDSVRINLLPQANQTPTLETIRVNVNEGIRENITKTLNLGDIPDTFIPNAKNSYNNIYFLPSGEATTEWQRLGIPERTTLQKIYAKGFVIQYYRPMEKISGTWYKENQITPLDTLVRTQIAEAVTWLNEDFASGFDDWINSGWSLDTGAYVDLSGEVGSGTVTQLVNIPSFTRVRLTYDIERSASSGIRNDVFEIILISNAAVLQVVQVTELSFDIQTNGEIEFTSLYDITAIGFRVRRLNGGGNARYEVYLFDIETVTNETYFTIMGMSLNDKMNEYNFELAELIPKGGDPNSQPGEEPGEGEDFSGDFNEDYGGDFDTILN
jgi:hypothetical protein